MAKRFRDSDLRNKTWYRALGPGGRDLWNYLHDACDAAGILEVDFDRIEFDLGARHTQDSINEVLAGKGVWLSPTRLFLPAFIEFQYGELSDDCNPHKAVIRMLSKRCIDPRTLTLPEGYLKGTLTLQDKDKDKEQEKDKHQFDLESAYRRYPRKEGKTPGLKRLKPQIKTQEDYDALIKAVENYAVSRRGQDPKFTKMFSTFVSEWRDWVDAPSDAPPPLKTLKDLEAGNVA